MASCVYSHFGATDHTAGCVHIRTYYAYTHGLSCVSGTEMPVHTADAYCSLFLLIIRLSAFANHTAGNVNIPTQSPTHTASVHATRVQYYVP